MRETFREWAHNIPSVRVFAPGRVNLIGEHTDYNGGFVLPAAIDRGVSLLGRARPDRMVRIRSLTLEAEGTFSLDDPGPQPDPWLNVASGLARLVAEHGHDLPGMDLLLESDLPLGAGLSSSAAYELALLEAYQGLGEFTLGGMEAALLAQRAEWEFGGVRCGIMDQAAVRLSRAGHALLLDCRDLAYRHIPINVDAELVIVHTGVPRELAGSAYNERRAECEEAARALGVGSLRAVTPELWAERERSVPEPARRRARHVIAENARVRAAAEALEAGDLTALAELFAASHRSLRDDYAVSSPELDALVAIAQEVSPRIAGRLTGAGFGGCAVNLVPPELVEDLSHAILEVYPSRTGRQPMILRCRPVDGAFWEEVEDEDLSAADRATL